MQRTWLYDQINQVLTAQGSALATNQQLIRKFKDALLAIPGATVSGSSDAVYAADGLDGVDRWDANGDLVFDLPVNGRSWFVIAFAGMGGAQLLIDLRYVTTVGTDPAFDPGLVSWAMSWSPSGAFTEDSDDARYNEVTAPDADATNPIVLWMTNDDVNDDKATVMHVVYTDDGSEFRSVWNRWLRAAMSAYYPQGDPAVFVSAGIVDDPPSGWAGPHTMLTATSSGASTNAMSMYMLADEAATCGSRLAEANTPYGALLGCEAVANASYPYPPRYGVDVFSAKYGLFPVSVRVARDGAGSATSGFAGVLSDTFYAGSDPDTSYGKIKTRYTLANGDKFLQWNMLAIPWGNNVLHIDGGGAVAITEVSGEIQCGCGTIGGTPPVVSNLIPADGDPILPNTPIQFDITDEDGFAFIMPLIILDPYRLPEVVHNNVDFEPLYLEGGSTRVAITNGYRYTLRRKGGWTTQPLLVIRAIDVHGAVYTE